MKLTIPQIQERIAEALPIGRVVPRHTAEGHFYEVNTLVIKGDEMTQSPIYPSVTGKLQILKDESLINYKMNQAIQYFFRKFKDITEANIMEHLDLAARASMDVLIDAGDIGTQIHDTREMIFSAWINSMKEKDYYLHHHAIIFSSFIDPLQEDIRLKSAIRALEKFVHDYNYIPIATELLVYSHKLKVAGTLDDLGMMDKVVREGDRECEHDMVGTHCLKCDRKVKRVFVLMDLKSSNALKSHYWFQVALYYEMFRKLTGLKLEMCFILKLSKEDGTYKIEEIKNVGKVATYAKSLLKVNEAFEYVGKSRKDSGKNVGEKIEL